MSCDNFQPRGQAVESVSTKRGVECGKVISPLVENNVPVPALSVNNGEYCGSVTMENTVGVTWCSHWIAALTSLGTRQSLNLPFCFRRLTRLLTQAFVFQKNMGKNSRYLLIISGTLWPLLRQFGRQHHAFARVWRYKRHFPEIEEGIH